MTKIVKKVRKYKYKVNVFLHFRLAGSGHYTKEDLVKMNFSIFLVCLIACATPMRADGSWHRFIKKYATVKILTDCLGEEYTSGWYKNYTEAVGYCREQLPEVYLRNLPLNELTVDSYPYEQSPQIPQINSDYSSFNFLNAPAVNPVAQNPGIPGILDQGDFYSALQGNLSQPILLVPLPYPLIQQLSQSNPSAYFLRKKRDSQTPVFDEEKIKEVYRKIQEKSANFTCVVKKLKIFNQNYDVDVTELMEHYNLLNLNVQLRTDISEGILDCIKFASCKPLNRMSLMPPVVQRAMSFLKCEAKQRVASCVKDDVRKMQHKFDKEALGDIKAGVDIDEGDKMMAIMWGIFDKS